MTTVKISFALNVILEARKDGVIATNPDDNDEFERAMSALSDFPRGPHKTMGAARKAIKTWAKEIGRASDVTIVESIDPRDKPKTL